MRSISFYVDVHLEWIHVHRQSTFVWQLMTKLLFFSFWEEKMKSYWNICNRYLRINAILWMARFHSNMNRSVYWIYFDYFAHRSCQSFHLHWFQIWIKKSKYIALSYWTQSSLLRRKHWRIKFRKEFASMPASKQLQRFNSSMTHCRFAFSLPSFLIISI